MSVSNDLHVLCQPVRYTVQLSSIVVDRYLTYTQQTRTLLVTATP